MQMEKWLDTGPVLLSQALEIGSAETGGQLLTAWPLGRAGVGRGLGLLRSGIPPVAQPQPAVCATYAHKLDKAEAKLDWTQPAQVLATNVRAFNPGRWQRPGWVGAGPVHGSICPMSPRRPPGHRPARRTRRHRIACGSGALRSAFCSGSGGKAVTAADYVNAQRESRR